MVKVLLALLASLGVGIALAQPDRPAPLSPDVPAAARSPVAAKRLSLRAGDDKPDYRGGSVFFVGTATVIIRYAGFTILTDPNFLHKGEHADLGYGLQAERVTNPAIEFDELPPIDFVLLSHYHGDHFDQIVEERLDPKTPIISTPEATEALRKKKFDYTIALEKWEMLSVTKGGAALRITALPARHGPPVVNRALPETMGSLLEFLDPQEKPLYRIYISGDTLVFDDIRQIPERFPEIDLALLHLGGTRIAGVLLTMDGEQGVEMLRIVKPDTAIPIHYDDYTVFESPLDDFVARVKAAGLEQKVRYLKHGDTYRFKPRSLADGK